jgi:N,N-dimethylformamidase
VNARARAGGRELIGYADKLSGEAGEAIRFMVSTSEPEYEAEIVRLIHGDENPAGPGLKEQPIEASANGRYVGRRQVVWPGSYVNVAHHEPFELGSFTLQTWIAPTTPGDGRTQAIMSRWCSEERLGYALVLDGEGRPALMLGRATGVFVVTREERLRTGNWYFVAGSLDVVTGRTAVYLAPRSPWTPPGQFSKVADTDDLGDSWPPQVDVPFRIAAASARSREAVRVTDAYNGKIDSPRVFGRALEADELEELAKGTRASDLDRSELVADWSFSANQSSVTIHDNGPHGLHGTAVNMPTRAVTGRAWTGRETDFRLATDEYSAIHFHADDVEDAAWDVDFEWLLPDGLRSGVYAARLQAGDLSDHIPFVVRPPRTGPRPRVLVLLPTMTYVAYANERVGDSYQTNKPPDWELRYDPLDHYLSDHPEFGKSLYDVHDDLSGVCYSSALRPIPNLRPRYRHRNVNAARHLAGDLFLIDWLEEKGFAYDVVADGDLHAAGLDLPHNYKVLITGGHPEYWTADMLGALEAWVTEEGGRLMYLGGNGVYWVTSVHQERPHVIEVRRGIAGSRPWESEPGELHHSTTGEPGGLWRFRGKLPNRLLGVAYAAEGGGESSGYNRTPESFDDAVSWVFDGVTTEGPIGKFGLVMSGAAGDEVDRADLQLGTPSEAVLLASSKVLPYYGVALEDSRKLRGGRERGEARADMVLLQTPGGGAVFSVGSISWSGSLSHNGYENDVSRITENVLRRFAELDSPS